MYLNKNLLLSAISSAQIAQRNIGVVLKAQICVSMQAALQAQLHCYINIEREAWHIASSRGWEMTAMRTGAVWLAGTLIQIQFSSTRTDANAAAWIIGWSTKSMIDGMKQLHRHDYTDERVLFICQKLLDCQQESIRQMQRFI